MNKLLHSQSVVVTLLIALSSFAHAITERLFNSVNAHLVDTRLDPLVNPNSCSSHVHSVFGSVNFASTVTRNDLHDPEWQDDTDKAEQTTSHIIPNRSMYWAPSLYIFNPEDELYYIVPSFSRTYYRIEHRGEVSGINPIPMFLQLIAGNARRTKEWLPTANHDDIRWTVRSNRQETNSMEHGDWGYLRRDPQIVADEDQLEMNVIFPNCLQVHDDGTPVISSADYRSHASYAYRNRCPESFPYHIPTVNLEVRYDLEAMRQLLGRDVVNNIDNWYLSTRDSSGAGAHADFVSGKFHSQLQHLNLTQVVKVGQKILWRMQSYIVGVTKPKTTMGTVLLRSTLIKTWVEHPSVM